jgi:hypothetical protein
VRQARRICRAHPASVRFCWDLDNTLVDSGTLIHAGSRLEQAAVDAGPVANMLEFYELVQRTLPDAEHVILSARRRSMRADTMAWLARHDVTTRTASVCFVPYADAKPEVWRQLGRDARLVIVDDLSYDHESDRPQIYAQLVAAAERTACVYLGLDRIAELAAGSRPLEVEAARIVAALGQPEGRVETS